MDTSIFFVEYLITLCIRGLLLGTYTGLFLNKLILFMTRLVDEQSYPIASQILKQSSHNNFGPSPFDDIISDRRAEFDKSLISYIMLKKRASDYKKSGYDLIVKILMAIITACLIIQFGSSMKFFCGFILVCGLITLSFIDLNTLTLPDQITLPLLWLGLFVNIFGIFSNLNDAVLGAISGYLFFYVISWLIHKIRKIEAMGQGDFKLIALLGAWFGWQFLPIIVFIAATLGSVVGITYIKIARKKLTIQLPFGPWLALAGVLVLLWGPKIPNYQFILIGLN